MAFKLGPFMFKTNKQKEWIARLCKLNYSTKTVLIHLFHFLQGLYQAWGDTAERTTGLGAETADTGNCLGETAATGNFLGETADTGNFLGETAATGNFFEETADTGNCLGETADTGNFLGGNSGYR